MAKNEKGKMKLIIESDNGAMTLRGKGSMKRLEAFYFYLHVIKCIRDAVEKSMDAEAYDTFRGGMVMCAEDPERFDKLIGTNVSCFVDMSKIPGTSHE